MLILSEQGDETMGERSSLLRPLNNCQEHSGMIARMNIGITLLTTLCGLLAYSSLWQLPKMELRITEQFNAMDKRVNKCESSIERIITQRNRDHLNKEPLDCILRWTVMKSARRAKYTGIKQPLPVSEPHLTSALKCSHPFCRVKVTQGHCTEERIIDGEVYLGCPWRI